MNTLDRSIRGSTVLITGAASGMGRVAAQVAVTDRNEAGAVLMAAAINGRGGTARAWGLDALRRYGSPEEVAHAMLSLALPASAYITGVVLPADGGQTARSV